MEVDLLQGLFHPLRIREFELGFLVFGEFPRLEDHLRVIEGAEFGEPILDVEGLRVVVVGLFDSTRLLVPDL